MGDLTPFAKMLIGMGAFLLLLGLFILLLGKVSGLGRLPGDIYINKGNFKLYFPLATSLLLSLLLTVLLNLFFRR
jgi:hypothetical protein